MSKAEDHERPISVLDALSNCDDGVQKLTRCKSGGSIRTLGSRRVKSAESRASHGSHKVEADIDNEKEVIKDCTTMTKL